MSTALELVYEYRHLMGKCRTGAGLTLDEIEAVEAIEGLFARGSSPFGGHDASGLSDRLGAILRGGRRQLWDKVELVAARLDALELRVSTFMEIGAVIELQIEDEELRLSYRFKGRVVSFLDEKPAPGGGHTVVLELVGLPLLVRRGPRSPKPDPKSAHGRRLRSEPRQAA